MIALLIGLASAQEPVVDALAAELLRTHTALHLEDAPALYLTRYRLLSLDSYAASASMGHLVSERIGPDNTLGVELRLGAPEYDNTGFGGWENGLGRASLNEELTPHTARLQAWRLSDRAYKEAVEQYARKRAQFEPPEDYPGDFTLAPPRVLSLGRAEAAQVEPLRALVRSLSEAMVTEPPLDRAEVYLGYEAGEEWLLDSAGSRVQLPHAELSVRAVAQTRGPDGALLSDGELWSVRGPGDLPPVEELEARGRALAEGLLAVAAAPALEDEYVGPVLFEEGAAVDLFRYLLVGQLEGTPGEVPFESWLGSMGQSKDPVRVLRRVLPDGWTVWDDPSLLPDHPGAFAVDAEGEPAQRVELVEGGVVRDLLMSRVPRKGLSGSNGHARGVAGSRLEGRVSLLEVRPARHLGPARLHRQALRLAEPYGRDWYLVVRRLQEPAVRGAGRLDGGLEAGSLPPPVAVYRVHRDGSEALLRGAVFAGVQRWMLRDIAAAGEQVEATWLAPLRGGRRWSAPGPVEGLPSWISAPEVLIREVELLPQQGAQRELPAIPPPGTSR
ncbi:MAG: hypothetical protein JXX28_14785 [Deltaproteobacteria bacterium]|nr:hypothetical protein [Deltaproteobacteria bacterium]